MIKVNGQAVEKDCCTVLSLVEESGRKAEWVAVMVNGEIVSKAEYGNLVLKDGDEVEVMSFVGGG